MVQSFGFERTDSRGLGIHFAEETTGEDEYAGAGVGAVVLGQEQDGDARLAGIKPAVEASAA